MEFDATLAAVRFGTGLSPDGAAPSGVGFMLAALDGPDLALQRYGQESWDDAVADAVAWGPLRRARRDSDEALEAFRTLDRAMRGRWFADLARTLLRGARTQDGFRERLAWFWADHFTVAGSRGYLRRTIPAYEADLRGAMTGPFSALLRLAVTHPAMVVYLNQQGSRGPNSPRGRRGGGLNENLAREVLELHTLGAGGPYTQTDVTQLAELMTGLTITKEGQPHFHRNAAEPGAETVLGRSYGGDAPNRHDLLNFLDDLAVHPATAAHVCRKLAVHFVADTPDADLVSAMTNAWHASEGRLIEVYAAMLEHPAAWAPELRKVRRPIEMMAAAMRALGVDFDPDDVGNRQIRELALEPLTLMGQPWQAAPGPDGWPEAEAAWITPQGLAARIDWAMRAPGAMGDLPEPRGFVDTALGPLARGETRFAAAAAETRAAGIGLVLASPEFQRR